MFENFSAKIDKLLLGTTVRLPIKFKVLTALSALLGTGVAGILGGTTLSFILSGVCASAILCYLIGKGFSVFVDHILGVRHVEHGAVIVPAIQSVAVGTRTYDVAVDPNALESLKREIERDTQRDPGALEDLDELRTILRTELSKLYKLESEVTSHATRSDVPELLLDLPRSYDDRRALLQVCHYVRWQIKRGNPPDISQLSGPLGYEDYLSLPDAGDDADEYDEEEDEDERDFNPSANVPFNSGLSKESWKAVCHFIDNIDGRANAAGIPSELSVFYRIVENARFHGFRGLPSFIADGQALLRGSRSYQCPEFPESLTHAVFALALSDSTHVVINGFSYECYLGLTLREYKQQSLKVSTLRTRLSALVSRGRPVVATTNILIGMHPDRIDVNCNAHYPFHALLCDEAVRSCWSNTMILRHVISKLTGGQTFAARLRKAKAIANEYADFGLKVDEVAYFSSLLSVSYESINGSVDFRFGLGFTYIGYLSNHSKPVRPSYKVLKDFSDEFPFTRRSVCSRIGPVCLDCLRYIPDLSCGANWFRGLEYRVVHDQDPCVLPSELHDVVSQMLSILEPLPCMENNWDQLVDDWLQESSYSGSRKKQLRALYDVYASRGYLRKKDYACKSFIKAEGYAEYKAPRVIISRSDTFKVVVGCFIKKIEDAVYNHPVLGRHFAKHFSVEDVVARMSEIRDNYKYVGETDYSSFEGSFSPKYLRSVEWRLLSHMLRNNPKVRNYVKACYFMYAGRRVDTDTKFTNEAAINYVSSKFGSVQFSGSRLSGELWTSLGNGFSNLVNLYACALHNGQDIDAIVEGDDAFIGMHSAFLNGEFFKRMGFTLKIVQGSDITDLDFCGHKVNTESGTRLSRLNLMVNAGWAITRNGPLSETSRKRLFLGKCLSGIVLASGNPVFQVYFARNIQLLLHEGIKVPKLDDENRWWNTHSEMAEAERWHTYLKEPTRSDRLLFEELYGVTVADQIAWEGAYDPRQPTFELPRGMRHAYDVAHNPCILY